MLATKNWTTIAFEPQAANDQLAILPVKAPVIVGEDTCLAAGTEHSNEAARDAAGEPQLESSWLQDWAAIWSSVGSSMLDVTLNASVATTVPPAPIAPAAPEVWLWTQTTRTAPAKSWYRPPTPNLFDPTAWGFPAPFAVYGVPMPLPSMLPGSMGFNPAPNPLMTQMFAPLYSMMLQAALPSAIGGWSGNAYGQSAFGQGYGSSGFGLPGSQPNIFANPFARQPENPMMTWLSSFAPQPVNPWAKLNSVVTSAFAPAPYSAYRSDSGHAVAQITIAEAKPGSSSAQEAAKAIWNLFAWPAPSEAQ